MTTIPTWREKLLTKYPSEVTSAPELDEDDFDWEQAFRRHQLEAARFYDPAASLPEELLVRLEGPTAVSSGMRVEWGGLLGPLQATLASSRQAVDLELFGFSKGSSVLHFRDASRAMEVEVLGRTDIAVDATPFADRVQHLLAAVNAAESGENLSRWKNQFDGLSHFASTLDAVRLDADLRLCTRGGRTERARLTGKGRGYLKELTDTTPQKQRQAIGGRITELRASGYVKVKNGVKRNSSVYEVEFDKDQLQEMRLVLGDSANWVVEASQNADGLGNIRSTTYSFVSVLQQPEAIL